MKCRLYMYLLIRVCCNTECSHLFHQKSLVPNTYFKSFHTLKPVDGEVSFRWDDGRDGKLMGSAMPGPVGVLGLIGLGLGICVLNWDYHVIQHFTGKSPQQSLRREFADLLYAAWFKFASVLLGSGFLSCVEFTFLFILSHCLLFPLFWFCSPAYSIYPSLSHFIMLSSVQFFLILFVLISMLWSVSAFKTITNPNCKSKQEIRLLSFSELDDEINNTLTCV